MADLVIGAFTADTFFAAAFFLAMISSLLMWSICD
jgi:hypothetical protein